MQTNVFENDTDGEGLVIYVDDSKLPANNGDSRDLSIILEHIRSNIPQFQLFEETNWKYFYIFSNCRFIPIINSKTFRVSETSSNDNNEPYFDIVDSMTLAPPFDSNRCTSIIKSYDF